MKQAKLLKTILFISCFLFLFFLAGQARAAVECNDSIDNDGDGKKDYSATAGAGDAECANANDDHESNNIAEWQAEPLWAKNSTWYEKIPNNPTLTANSANFINAQHSYSHRLTFGTSHSSGHPIYYVDKNQANVNVDITNQVVHETWGWNYVPIPAHAVPAGNYITSDCPGAGRKYQDGSMRVISKEKRCSDVAGNYNTQSACEAAGGHWGRWEWDFFRVHNCTIETSYDPAQWVTKNLVKYDLDGDGMNQPYDISIGSTRAYAGAGTHGPVTYEEMDDAINHGIPIPHALAYAAPGVAQQGERCGIATPTYSTQLACETAGGTWGHCSNGSLLTQSACVADGREWVLWNQKYPTVYPDYLGYSTAYNYFGQYTMRLGARWQISPEYNCDANISILYERALCHALQTYGAIFIDNAGSQSFTGEDLNKNPYQDGRKWTDLDSNIQSAIVSGDEMYQLSWGNIKNYARVVAPIMPASQCINGTAISSLGGGPCMTFTEPQCADGIDNDNPPDGKIDYPADPGCSSAYGDNSESGALSDTIPPAAPSGLTVQ